MTVASAGEIAERYARVCDEVGPAVTVVVATKYVSADEMGALAEAGVAVVGENRAQDLEEKHALYGDAFRWHFIGHLQSNKVKVVNRLCELVHSVGTDSAARRVTIPALLEVNLTGESSKSGVAPEEIGAYVERYALIRGLMTMPPLADDPEASRAHFAASPRARRRAGLDRAQHGHVAGLPRGGRRGCDARSSGRDDLPSRSRRRPQGRPRADSGTRARRRRGRQHATVIRVHHGSPRCQRGLVSRAGFESSPVTVSTTAKRPFCSTIRSTSGFS